MGGNIVDGNFLGGNFPSSDSPGKNLMDGNFPGRSFPGKFSWSLSDESDEILTNQKS